MVKRQTATKRLPVHYPSVPDRESKPGTYNEPPPPRKPDVIPSTGFELGSRDSKADLRLRIEQLLLRRDSVRASDWAALGDAARALLVQMLDDQAVRSRDAVFHRLIAILGQLSVKRSVAPLATILTARSESNLTKAYAATALGHIGEPSAIEALVGSLTVKDDMVRRQAAKALGRLDHVAVIPHLLRLQTDKSAAVAEVATEALQRWEKKLDQRVGAAKKTPARKSPRKKAQPAAER